MKPFFQYLKISFLFLCVFEISRLYFVLYNASAFDEGYLFGFLATAYHGFLLDMSAVAYCTTPLLLIAFLEQLFRKKSPVWVTCVVLILEFLAIFFITISDPELFIQWGNKFNHQVLVYVSHPLEMALSAGSANWVKTILFALVMLLIFVFIVKKILKVWGKANGFSVLHIIVLLILMGFNFILIRGGVGVTTISQSSAIYSDKSAHNAAAVNSLWNAFYYLLNNTSKIYGKSHIYVDARIAEKEFSQQVNPHLDSFSFSSTARPNVMIVMLESFTASASQYFSGKNNCTPFLDSLARQNLSFMACYASGDRTEKGLVSVLSGYPAQPASSIIVFPDKMAKLPSISKVLQPLGYKNIFIYGGDAEFAAMKSYLLIHEFQQVIDKRDFKPAERNSKWGAHDGVMYNKTLEVLKTEKGPFLSVLLSLSSHEPFDVPYESPDLKKDGWYGYKNSLRYADKCLYDFMQACKLQPWYANTIIVLVADHGHDIGLEHTFYFGKEKYHIPLIITGGALKEAYKGVQVQAVVSQTIIPSLLLQNFGLSTEGFRWQTDVYHPNGFAQYHYNNGFGRVNKRSEAVSDNSSHSYYFRGDKSDSLKLKHDGKVFQQILIDDFLKK